MNESKLEIFLAKMKVAASDGSSESSGSSGSENTTADGRNSMMRRWLYFTKEQLTEQDKRIIRLCRYPDMIPDRILVDYAQVLLASLGRLRRDGRLYTVIGNELRNRVLDIAGRLDKNESGTYWLETKIRHEICELASRNEAKT